jgi:hypothetical protein
MDEDTAAKPRALQDNRSKHNKLSSQLRRQKSDGERSDDSIKPEKRQPGPAKPKIEHDAKSGSKSSTKGLEKLPETSEVNQSEGVELSQEDINDWMNMLNGPPLLVEKNGSAFLGNHAQSQRKDGRSGHRKPKAEHDCDNSRHAEQVRFQPRSEHRHSKHEAGTKETTVHQTNHKKGNRSKNKKQKSSSKNRCIFPFLALPRELRDMIYEYTIDLSGIIKNVKDEGQGYHDGMQFINSKKEQHKMVQLMMRLQDRHGQMDTPTVLLVNRQIYEEALDVLHKRSIIFDAPAINSPTLFPLMQMISPELMRSVRSIEFRMPMKQHTDSTMAGELQIGSNWFSHTRLNNESLDNSQCWAYFMFDLIAVLWTPGHRVEHMTISIIGDAGSRDYMLRPNQETLSGLDKTMQGCIKSRNLEHFLSYLGYAEIPETK